MISKFAGLCWASTIRWALAIVYCFMIANTLTGMDATPVVRLFTDLTLYSLFLLSTLKMKSDGAQDLSLTALLVPVLHLVFPIFIFNQPASLPTPLYLAGALITSFGAMIVMLALIDLGDSFTVLVSFNRLKTSGIYRLVRHPMYLGHGLLVSGAILMYLSWTNVLVFFAFWLITLWRIQLEESFLSNMSPHYSKYMAKVRHRIIPLVY